LIPEENEVVLLALKRLPPKEAYDRVFRMRRAFQVRQPSVTNWRPRPQAYLEQCSLAHQLLPKAEQTKPEEVSIKLLCTPISADSPLGPSVPVTTHRGNRGRNQRARGLGVDGYEEEISGGDRVQRLSVGIAFCCHKCLDCTLSESIIWFLNATACSSLIGRICNLCCMFSNCFDQRIVHAEAYTQIYVLNRQLQWGSHSLAALPASLKE